MRGRFKLLILILGFLLAALTVVTVLDPEKNSYDQILSQLAHPIVLVNHKIKIFLEQQNWRLSEADLVRRMQTLEEAVSDLQAQNIALIAQNQYCLEHQELIEFSKRYDFNKQILAQIFFKNLSPQEHYVLLDQGELSGVQPGMVAVYQNCLIGKVTKVYPRYCQVILITDRNCKIAVYDEKTGAVGICYGKNDLKQIVLDYVSHLQKINLDDLLISSGEGEIFPQGFGVGKINDLNIAGMYYEAHASLLIDIEKIKSCYLIAANKS